MPGQRLKNRARKRIRARKAHMKAQKHARIAKKQLRSAMAHVVVAANMQRRSKAMRRRGGGGSGGGNFLSGILGPVTSILGGLF